MASRDQPSGSLLEMSHFTEVAHPPFCPPHTGPSGNPTWSPSQDGKVCPNPIPVQPAVHLTLAKYGDRAGGGEKEGSQETRGWKSVQCQHFHRCCGGLFVSFFPSPFAFSLGATLIGPPLPHPSLQDRPREQRRSPMDLADAGGCCVHA